MDLRPVLDEAVQPAWPDDDAGTPDTSPSQPSLAQATAVPDWAEDDVLDRFFASWTPGPPPDAPSAELEMVDLVASRDDPAPDDGAEPNGNGHHRLDRPGEPASTPAATGRTRWARADDDVFPGTRRRGRWGRSLGWYRR
jgi:hypothetical protein